MIKKVDIADYFPIPKGGLRDNCITTRSQDVVAGYNLALPQLFTMSDDQHRVFHDDFANIIKRLPSGTHLHFQDMRYTKHFEGRYDGESKVQKENYKSYYNRKLLDGRTNLYVTFSNKTLQKVNALDSPFLRYLEYFKSDVFRDTPNLISQYKKLIGPLENDLSLSGHLGIKRLSSDELRAAIGDYFGMRYNMPLSVGEAKDYTLPDYYIEDGFLRIGGQFVAVLSLVKEGVTVVSSGKSSHMPRSISGIKTPQTTSLPVSMIYPMTLGIPFDHIVNVGIEVVDNQLIKGLINKEKFGTNVLAGFMEEAKEKNLESKAFLETIGKYHYQACRLGMNIIVNDFSLASLEEKVGFVKNRASKMNESVLYQEGMEAGNLFFLSSPGSMKGVNRTIIETVDQAVSYIPREQLYASDPDGPVFVSPFGEPVGVNFFDAPGLDNRNCVCFGPSGTGKSVVLNHLTDQFVALKCKVFIADVGASYQRNCIENNGLYLDSNVAKDFSFNPFLCKQGKDGEYLFEPKEEDDLIKNYVVNNVYSNIAAIVNDKARMTATTKAVIKKSIRSFYEMVNAKKIFPDLTEYFHYTRHYESEVLEPEYRGMVDFSSIRLLMESFAVGQNKRLLNSRRNDINSEAALTVAELKGIMGDEDVREIVFLNVLNNIARIVEKGGFRYFYAILDEVVDYLKGDFGDSIGGFFRKIRKDGGGVIVATQGIDYLDQIDPLVKASVLSNCDIKILTNHSKYTNLFGSLRSQLALTDFDFELLKSLEKDTNSREVFFNFGSEPRKYRVELSPFAYGLYNTTKSDLVEINRMMGEYGSQRAAIAQFIENKFKSSK
jgi:hypothetical protein